MKFSDGFWQMRAGYQPFYAAEVHEVEDCGDRLVVYAPTRRLSSRGDTLNLPVLTVEFSSPMENVIRVRLAHHLGGQPRRPQFEVFPQPACAVEICQDEALVSLRSGQLSVQVRKQGPWTVEFRAGEHCVTSSGWRGMGFVDTPEGRFIHEQLALGVGECVYGLSERFTAFVKNGQVVDLWNEDGGTSSEQAYKNIPFYLTNRGYGVFINHPERVSLEVASEMVEKVQFSVPGETLEYFLIYGPDPKVVLQRYTALTGRPALPPAWSFGLWLSTSFTTDYDEATVTRFIQGMADRDIPLHVFHFDCFWMKEFQWCDFQWDRRVFPEPAEMLARLKARGLHVCVWINPYIAQRSALFAEGARQGYLLRRPNGDVWQWDKWQAGMGLVDFTNPDARAWFARQLRNLLEMGVDCFKTDFGERIPTDVVYADGSDPQRMHNYYTFLYNQTVFQALEEVRGEGEATLFARSATAGGQRFPVHWGGDSTATFESMAETLRGGLSLGLCGFGFWSHDIGGFEQTASAAVYKRWCAFGLLSSHSRLHGSSSYRVPWLFDVEAVDVLRFFTRLKCRLMPYLFAAAVQAQRWGLPMLRAMLLEFPTDPACDTLDRQYMLGDSLLVAPVFSAAGEVDYYLPAGRWTNLLSGEEIEGGCWRRERHGFLSLPLLVRPNTLLALGAQDDRPDYDLAEGVVLHLFALAAGQQTAADVPALNGALAWRAVAQREDGLIRVAVEGAAHAWQLVLHGISTVKAVQGGRARPDDLGWRIEPDAGAQQVIIAL
jgi:alpha-D-xyloside xylohydrolase